jgi:hypothetical protein
MLTARRTWCAIVCIAAIHDYLMREDQLTDHSRILVARFPIVGRLALYTMAAHLAHDLPRRLDWVSGLGWIVSRVRA